MTVTIGRRKLLAVLGGTAVAWPLAARAQQPAQVRRIGVLMNVTESDRRYQSYLVAFQQALRGFGWIDGQTIRVDVRWSAGDPERALANAPELVALAPDVILSASTLNLTALQRTTRTIPIVFVLVSDPVAQASFRTWRIQGAISPALVSMSHRWAVSGSIC